MQRSKINFQKIEKISSRLSDQKHWEKWWKSFIFWAFAGGQTAKAFGADMLYHVILLTNSKKPAICQLFGVIQPKSAAESGVGCTYIADFYYGNYGAFTREFVILKI